MKHLTTLLAAMIISASAFSQLKDTLLKEVVVKAKKPLLTHAIDRTIVNVDAMLSSATSNTLEVLEKTPGVSVNSNGDISLNGRGGVLVLINGRSTYMSGSDLASYLKSIPGATLDKIELMDNPPAKYDAAGSAVINIRLKRNRAGGFTGNIASGFSQGKYARANNSLNLNYNTKKVNLFTNIGHNTEKAYTDDNFDRKFYDEQWQPIARILLFNHTTSRHNSLNINAGMDYNLSAKTTIGAIANINTGMGSSLLDYTSENFTGRTSNYQDRTNISTNINMLHRINNQGHELNAEINYLRYDASGYQDMQHFYYDLPGNINIYTANADYVLPLKNKFKFEAGIKSSLVDNNSTYDYYDIDGPVKTLNTERSNNFIFHENINSVYANSQKAWKRFGVQLGIRAENTHNKGRQPAYDITFTKDYTRLFPTLFLQYQLDSTGKNIMSFMYNRRINRPNYQMMNPFLIFRDNYSYTQGNPNLVPQYQDRFEIKFRHRQLLNMGLSYNNFTNVLFHTTEAIDTILITRPNNVGRGYMVLLNTGISMTPVKWWNFNLMVRLSHIGLKGKTYTENLNPSTNLARIEWQNYFTITNTLNAELGGYYGSRDLSGQTFTKGMYRVYFTVQKKILEDKASIRLGMEDIFHSWVYKNQSISLKQAEYFQLSESDTRRVSLAFTYRFGKSPTANKRRQRENAGEERSRIE